MSYYSELAIVCEEGAYRYLDRIMENNQIVPAQKYEITEGYFIYFRTVSFDDDSKEGKILKLAFSYLNRNDVDHEGYGFKYYRQGENTDDVVISGNVTGYEYIDYEFTRSIDLPMKKNDFDLSNHSDRNIYNGCISLMNHLVEDFTDWLEYVGFDLQGLPEGERFSVNYPVSKIVRDLLLLHTSHAGGTSTALKCKELGLEWGTDVEFSMDHAGDD